MLMWGASSVTLENDNLSNACNKYLYPKNCVLCSLMVLIGPLFKICCGVK